MTMTQVPYRVWEPDQISRFWNYFGKRVDLHPEYFSYQVGKGLVTLLSHTGRLQDGASVLDYGCGPGFLVKELLKSNVCCYATDASVEAVQIINDKFQGRSNWMGAVAATCPPTVYPDAFFDIVTCIETLEHLTDDVLPDLLAEIHRLLKPGGAALLTTPNNENLAHSYIFCPFCESEYHKVQHVRSFTSGSMRMILESHGFEVLFCEGINLWEFQRTAQGWKDWSPRVGHRWLRDAKNKMLDRLDPKAFPHGRSFTERAKTGPHLCAFVERPR